jgi:hypothetical protein
MKLTPVARTHDYLAGYERNLQVIFLRGQQFDKPALQFPLGNIQIKIRRHHFNYSPSVILSLTTSI